MLKATVAVVRDRLDHYDATRGGQAIAAFIDDLSNWYVRRSRPRFWKSSDPAAHATLHRCLVVASQLLAPLCPFLADELFTTLTGRESVHLSDWPEPTGDVDRTNRAALLAALAAVVHAQDTAMLTAWARESGDEIPTFETWAHPERAA